MTLNFLRTRSENDESIEFQPIERLKVYLFGATILFASDPAAETDRKVSRRCRRVKGRIEKQASIGMDSGRAPEH